MTKYVSYRRVSTARQGQSGLGLEAQDAVVNAFVSSRGGAVVARFVEVESGRHDERPELDKAIAAAQALRATLLIAKLDRLSRNVGFIFRLRDSGVAFVCCDNPEMNTVTVGVHAVMAQHEREVTSQRTKDALAAKKARGHQLGTPANLTPAARQQGLEKRRENARTNLANVQARQLSGLYRSMGWAYRQIAEQLNATGYRTRRGKLFNGTGIQRLLRAEERNPEQAQDQSDAEADGV